MVNKTDETLRQPLIWVHKVKFLWLVVPLSGVIISKRIGWRADITCGVSWYRRLHLHQVIEHNIKKKKDVQLSSLVYKNTFKKMGEKKRSRIIFETNNNQRKERAQEFSHGTNAREDVLGSASTLIYTQYQYVTGNTEED